ncbi:FliC/FljB family flagellin [Halomonas sp. TBZ9]|uniref:Flagellin n=1 Tax=Vreelandella azerica TaxID=2732867 RepID=A0A7Y3XBX3_9GAMM|nr:FliC/FljB family flagellin [Halomonas azerica]NOG32803.1 FliC/FljB family flagellin [Halomonas azerica]
MSVINTNITSMIGQQNLRESQNALSTSMERLSSGLRINSAKDDAAGQAIANRMSSQITGLSQAQRNANDGISVAQTAEGGLNQINDNLQRIRELTVQSQNGTNSQADLNSIQNEIDQRITEIDRISEETDFNGVKVLDEGSEAINIQVGANDGEVISVELTAINSDTLNLDDFNVNGAVGATSDLAAGGTISGGGTFEGSTIVSGGAGVTLDGNDAASGGTLVEDQNGNYFVELSSGGGTFAVDNLRTTTNDAGEITAVTVTVGSEVPGASRFSNPLGNLDASLNTVDNLRSELGAVQNRFESAITNLSTNETNLSAARSRIEDADYAVEVADMTRSQILQQAGTSVLAQANQIPQNVLSLLG